MEQTERKRIYLERDVVERYGRGIPKYRKATKGTGYVRSFDRTDRTEMEAVRSWLAGDDEFRRLVDVYACYCRILADRGYGSSADRELVLLDHPALVDRLALNFAKCDVEYVWHDLLCNADEIMSGEGGDGYWPFLDAAYIDIAHIRVGKAIVNLDEVWAVVDGALREFTEKCVARERNMLEKSCYCCDRCGAAIYGTGETRFDPYENILHCEKCAKECTHWKGRRA